MNRYAKCFDFVRKIEYIFSLNSNKSESLMPNKAAQFAFISNKLQSNTLHNFNILA
jgi:hypothetical protein